jgi:regulator of protease activity HflC (stomatin/prohibitin superfamily)
MADEQQIDHTTSSFGQLTQARVPLEDAADAFATRDASGRIPIVLVPKHSNRIRNDVVLAALIVLFGGIGLGLVLDNVAIMSFSIIGGVILAILGVYRSFIVRIPEGVNGLLTKGGRYLRTVGSGTHFVPLWIPVSHLVTRREIPFDVPVVEAITKDNVRANLDILLTFHISEPYEFVFNISADDFDQVFQAACQDALRRMIRKIKSDDITDLNDNDLVELLERLGEDISPYGVEITKISITFAQPPDEFILLKESLKLVSLQKIEQKEKQDLALRQQADEEALARQKVVASVEQRREELQARYQSSESRKRIVQLEADAEDLRLKKLEERLKKYPRAAEHEMELKRLEIARALAGNTRAMLQVGSADDIARAFVLRDIIRDSDADKSDGNQQASQTTKQDETSST